MPSSQRARHPGARAGAVGRERVADDRAGVVADELGEGGGALVVADPMHNDTRCGQTPHLPRLGTRRLKARPSGLVETDHGSLQHVYCERRVDEGESFRDRVGEIPQRLRRDDQAVPLEDPTLPLERDEIEPLVEDDLDGERERVATARQRALGTERSLDAAAASAHVLLLLDLDQLVANLDDIDQLGRLELACHRAQITAATRARTICIVEGEHPLDHGQERRRRRAGRGALGSLLPVALFSALLLLRLGACDGVGRELCLGLQRLEHLERELQIAGLAAEPLDLAALRGDHVEELLDLRLLSLRDPA